MSTPDPKKQDEPRPGHLWLNIGKIIFLIVVLVVAWFVLEKLIEGK